jgi:hypothetical protein
VFKKNKTMYHEKDLLVMNFSVLEIVLTSLVSSLFKTFKNGTN